MTRDEFIRRITAALLAGQRESDLADPARAAAYATSVADKLPGLFRVGIRKIVRRG